MGINIWDLPSFYNEELSPSTCTTFAFFGIRISQEYVLSGVYECLLVMCEINYLHLILFRVVDLMNTYLRI